MTHQGAGAADGTVRGLNARGRGPLLEKMGLEWLEASPERVVARIPVEGNAQPYGLLHGGASAALAESIASAGAWLADPSQVALGIEIKVNHLRPVRSGWVTGVGTPLHRGANIQVWEVRLTDDEGRLTAFATCTVAIRGPEE
ncbi:MAG: PaaI family thioesterase [Acidimicrobiales bacterium]